MAYTLTGTVRDFLFAGSQPQLLPNGQVVQQHPDFQNATVSDRGIVGGAYATLGTDGLPVYANTSGQTTTTHGRSLFDIWFRDFPSYNTSAPYTVSLAATGNPAVVSFSAAEFLPFNDFSQAASAVKLRDEGTTSSGGVADYGYTYQAHTSFTYHGTEVLDFRSDDDLFVYVNQKLVVDLGGVHGVQAASLDLSQPAVKAALGLELGGNYAIDIFHADRHTPGTNFAFQVPTQATLQVHGTADDLVTPAEAQAVAFDVDHFDGLTGRAAFTDGTRTVEVNVSGNGRFTADLSGFVGTVTAKLLVGSQTSAVGNDILTGNGDPVHVPNDFNGDGKADLLWRNDNGVVANWMMNGASIQSGATISQPGGEWQIKGGGDFNGDGKSDILWRKSDGTVAAWMLDGGQLISGGNISQPGNNFRLVGSGDFNGDGKSDVLFRDADGTVSTWLMNGTEIASGGSIGAPGLDWHVVGTGDFNGDSNADILWRNDDGTVATWLLNGTQILGGGNIGQPGSDWKIADTGDFDADGKSDIVWRNDDGTVGIWLLNGVQLAGGGNAGQPGNEWHLEAAADLNGDLHDDIIWRNSDGTVAAWLMDSTQIVSGGNLGQPGIEWHIQNNNYDFI